MENKKLYQSQSAKTSSLDEIKEISKGLGFDIPDEELCDYRDLLDIRMKDCNILDDLQEPTLPVKYPRTPGYRPSPEENTHNAWYYKTNIPGSGKGLLAGKKIAIKDNVPVAGVPMMNGSRLLEGYVPEFDATVVTRILDAGGSIMGKAVCEEFCMSGNSFTCATPPVLNPVNKQYSSGGSSTGSAVLVALGEVDMAVGGDQGGSIRMPSSWCGIVGLKPTFGLVPYTGISSMEPWIDHVGPMARTVKDCALLLQAMSGYDDGLDPRQRSDVPVVDYVKEIGGDQTVKGLKVGLLMEGFYKCDEGIKSVVMKAVKAFLPEADIEDASAPLHSQAALVFWGAGLNGIYNTIFQNHGCFTGFRGFYPTSMAEYTTRAFECRANDLPPSMKLLGLFGEMQKRKYGTKYYCKAMNLCRLMQKQYDDILEKYDLIVMPTTPITALKLAEEGTIETVKDYIDQLYQNVKNTSQFNMTGHPALSINAGYLNDMPVGMMMVAKHFDEKTILRAASVFEAARDAAEPIKEIQ